MAEMAVVVEVGARAAHEEAEWVREVAVQAAMLAAVGSMVAEAEVEGEGLATLVVMKVVRTAVGEVVDWVAESLAVASLEALMVVRRVGSRAAVEEAVLAWVLRVAALVEAARSEANRVSRMAEAVRA